MTSPRRKKGKARGGAVDGLLTVTFVALALVIAAYLTMPDFARGARTVVAQVAKLVGFDGEPPG